MSGDSGNSNDRSLAGKPDHVPQALVFDFDLFRDSALIADPHDRILELLKVAPPVFWTRRNGGHWLVTDYEGNFDIALNTDVFSSTIVSKPLMQMIREMTPPGAPRIVKPIFLDPPEHSQSRLCLASVFSPKSIKAMQEDIRQLARQLIADVADARGCES